MVEVELELASAASVGTIGMPGVWTSDGAGVGVGVVVGGVASTLIEDEVEVEVEVEVAATPAAPARATSSPALAGSGKLSISHDGCYVGAPRLLERVSVTWMTGRTRTPLTQSTRK